MVVIFTNVPVGVQGVDPDTLSNGYFFHVLLSRRADDVNCFIVINHLDTDNGRVLVHECPSLFYLVFVVFSRCFVVSPNDRDVRLCCFCVCSWRSTFRICG